MRSSSSTPSTVSQSNTSSMAGDPRWSQDQDQRLRAAVANVDYEQGISSSTSASIKPWLRIAQVAFPHGEHSKDECAARFHLLTRPRSIKGAWGKVEDDGLRRLVEQYGTEHWVVIAQHLGSRTGKQCRERWHNHLDPSITRGPFTPQEDATIIALYNSIGSKWAEISKRLKGRPDNSIKNHFNTTLSRRCMLAAVVERGSDYTDKSSSRTENGQNLAQSTYYSSSSETRPTYSYDAATDAQGPQLGSTSSYSHPAYGQDTHDQRTPRLNSSAAQQQRYQTVDKQRSSPSSFDYGTQPYSSYMPAAQQHVGQTNYPYAQQIEYRDNVFAYSVPEYANQFASTPYMPSHYQPQPDTAPVTTERTISTTDVSAPRRSSAQPVSSSSLRQQAESLSSWQSINGQRALPPLSLVAVTARDVPLTPDRPRAQSTTRLASSAALLSPFLQQATHTSSKRLASDFDDETFDERPHQRACGLATSSTFETRSFSPASHSPYFSRPDELSAPGSALTAASSLLPSPSGSDAEAHDYFGNTTSSRHFDVGAYGSSPAKNAIGIMFP